MSLEQPEFFRLFLASSWVQVILLYKQLFFLHTQTHRKVGSFLNYSSQFELCLKKVEHPQAALYVFSHQVHVISANRYNLVKASYENYYEHFILEEGKWITLFLFLCGMQTPLHLHIMQTSRRKQLVCQRTSNDNSWVEQSVAVPLVSQQAY